MKILKKKFPPPPNNFLCLSFLLTLSILLFRPSAAVAQTYYDHRDMAISFEDRVTGSDFDMNDAVYQIKWEAKSGNCSGNECQIKEIVFAITPLAAGAMDTIELRIGPFFEALQTGIASDYEFRIVEHKESSPINYVIPLNQDGFVPVYTGVSDHFTTGGASMINVFGSTYEQGKTRAFTLVFGTECSGYGGGCDGQYPIIDRTSTASKLTSIGSMFHLENCSQNKGNHYDSTNGMKGSGNVVMVIDDSNVSLVTPSEYTDLRTAYNLSNSCDIVNGSWVFPNCENEISNAISATSYSADTINIEPGTSTYFNRPSIQYRNAGGGAGTIDFGTGSAFFGETSHASVHAARTHDDIIDVLASPGTQFTNGGPSAPTSLCSGGGGGGGAGGGTPIFHPAVTQPRFTSSASSMEYGYYSLNVLLDDTGSGYAPAITWPGYDGTSTIYSYQISVEHNQAACPSDPSTASGTMALTDTRYWPSSNQVTLTKTTNADEWFHTLYFSDSGSDIFGYNNDANFTGTYDASIRGNGRNGVNNGLVYNHTGNGYCDGAVGWNEATCISNGGTYRTPFLDHISYEANKTSWSDGMPAWLTSKGACSGSYNQATCESYAHCQWNNWASPPACAGGFYGDSTYHHFDNGTYQETNVTCVYNAISTLDHSGGASIASIVSDANSNNTLSSPSGFILEIEITSADGSGNCAAGEDQFGSDWPKRQCVSSQNAYSGTNNATLPGGASGSPYGAGIALPVNMQ